MIPGFLKAQENNEAIPQIRKTVFRLQQELLLVKEALDRQDKELRSQREDLEAQMERLNKENQKLNQHLLQMDSLLFQMEDRLESSSMTKLSKQLEDLRDFNQAVILDNIGQITQSEKLLLDIVNKPETNLPKDLLILMLAQQKKRHQLYNESISYYSTLLAEFFTSPYFSQAIYEMSDVLGETGKTESQITLLAQLASLSKTDPYSLRAVEKLKALGASPLFEEEITKTNVSEDVKKHAEQGTKVNIGTGFTDKPVSSDASNDTTSDSPENIQAEKVGQHKVSTGTAGLSTEKPDDEKTSFKDVTADVIEGKQVDTPTSELEKPESVPSSGEISRENESTE